MSQGTETLWKGVLKRDRALRKALSDTSVIQSCDDPVNDNTLAGFDTGIADDGSELETDDLFAGFDTGLDDDAPQPLDDDPFAGFNTEFDDDESELYESENAVDVLFKDSVDLWLSRSHLALEHVLLAMGLTGDVFPTNRPLLIFGSHRSRLTAPEYHRVEVTRESWPRRLQATELLTSIAAAKILASSATGTSSMPDPMCFDGETVAVEVPNPLLARDRWIVLWPELKVLPEQAREETDTEAALHQWGRVRRVVWCVNREQMGPRDVIDWLFRFWQDTPIRIALFRAASFVYGEKDEVAQSKVLPKVRRTLEEKFDIIKGHPWIVVEP